MGATGAAGTQGPQGLTGAAGSQGPQGLTGAAGTQGPQGNVGGVGPQGSTGGIGPQGLTGAAGTQGPQGAQGAASSVAGPQGATGVQGATGPQGDIGPQGPAGSSGTGGAYPSSSGVAAGVQGTTNSGAYVTTLGGTGAGGTIAVNVNVPASGNVMVLMTAGVDPGSNNAYMSWAMTGANAGSCTAAPRTQAICDSQALVRGGSTFMQNSAVYYVGGLNPGNTTFTLVYRSAGGTAAFVNRNLIVQPLP
jgi:hypothetical protein